MADQTERLVNLRKWNIGIGGLHLVQGILILVLSTSFAIPIVATVMTGPPGGEGSLSVTKHFFDFNFPIAIALFLFLAAGDHLLTSVTPLRSWYERNLLQGINYARWIEYSASASIMIVLIALLNGINNLYAIIAIFGVNAAMILFGLVMEQVNRNRESVNWLPFIFGCIAGIIPWIAIVIGLITSATDNTMINGVPVNADGVPPFVYGIVISLFLLFNCFALNQWLQYRGKGKFADYLYGEKVYLVLSLVAKSALAWQIFGGTLASSS
ncbi:MAG: heliorhodopsin HeR [Actinobacteria bacterium]|nr:heliorhodopsin HeR [Actinomycetota bacterium]